MAVSSFLHSPQPSSSSTYHLAFENWVCEQQLAGKLRRPASVEVYRAMWGSLIAWSAALVPALSLTALREADLADFQASLRGQGPDHLLTPRYRRRLLGLIDRVLRHDAHNNGQDVNDAAHRAIHSQPEVRYAEKADSTPLPEVLDADEATRLIAFVGTLDLAMPWQQVRNRVSVAMQLGAGLSPGDVRAAALEGVSLTSPAAHRRQGRMRLPGNGNSPARETPIAPWAAELLTTWLHVRTEQGIPGHWLFPSTRTGKPWTKVAQYGASKQVLADAGLDGTNGGSFKLRHTFALRQLENGATLDEVARWLGVSDLAKMKRYERMLKPSSTVV